MYYTILNETTGLSIKITDFKYIHKLLKEDLKTLINLIGEGTYKILEWNSKEIDLERL